MLVSVETVMISGRFLTIVVESVDTSILQYIAGRLAAVILTIQKSFNVSSMWSHKY